MRRTTNRHVFLCSPSVYLLREEKQAHITFAFIGAASHTEACLVLSRLGNMETLIIIRMDFLTRSNLKQKNH